MMKNQLVLLYRNALKTARNYGKVAELKRMSALDEIDSLNKTLKFLQLSPRNSLSQSVMTPSLALGATRSMYRRVLSLPMPMEDRELFIGDALAAFKRLSQKMEMFRDFPEESESKQVINGIEIKATSRFVKVKSCPQDGLFRHQLFVQFTNLLSPTLQLVTEHLFTKDENCKENKSERALLNCSQKPPPPLTRAAVYKHTTCVALPTPLGSWKCDYSFADPVTGEIFRVSIPPLLLSTHDPDYDRRESCYRGDPDVDLEVVILKTRRTDMVPVQVETGKIPISPSGGSREGKKYITVKADDDGSVDRDDSVVKQRQSQQSRTLRSLDDFAESDQEDDDDDVTHLPTQKSPQ